MILIADASALIALATCDSPALLEVIFGNVLVPEAVFDEVIGQVAQKNYKDDLI